jgi:hypothetical protein
MDRTVGDARVRPTVRHPRTGERVPIDLGDDRGIERDLTPAQSRRDDRT